MIGLLLLLTAQAATTAPPDPPPASSPARRVCRAEPGSDAVVCKPASQQAPYRVSNLPASRYGPAVSKDRSIVGGGVKLRGRATNAGRRNRPTATVSVPF